MLVRRAHTTSIEIEQDHEFRCGPCGARYRVRVRSEGVGHAKERLIDGAGEAAGRADIEARRTAMETAESAVALAPCPRCGRRDGAAVRAFAARTAATVGGTGAFFFAVGLTQSPLAMAATVASLFALIALGFSIRDWRSIRKSQASLRFEPFEAAEATGASPPAT